MATRDSKSIYLPWILVILLIIALIYVIQQKREKLPPPNLQPFTIKLTDDFEVIATDEKGDPVKPIPTSEFYPKKIQEITKLATITVMEVVGSHYLTIELAGNTYQIPLPH